MDDNSVYTDKENSHSRHASARAPKRREQPLSGIDMAHISESLEESVSSYEHAAYRPKSAAQATLQTATQAKPQRTEQTVSQSAAQRVSQPDAQITPQPAAQAQSALSETAVAAQARIKPIESADKTLGYIPDPDSEHYEAELVNMKALRDAQAKRRAVRDMQGSETVHARNPEVAEEISDARTAAFGYRSPDNQEKPSTHSSLNNKEKPEKKTKKSNNKESKEGNGNKEGKEKRRHPVLKILLLLLVLGLGFVGYKFITGQSGYYTVAVFGVDSRNGNVNKEALSDVNIIARIDRASGEIKLVSMYRDTYTMINSDGTYHKLNEAYFRGGAEQAVWAVEHNTDVKVDDYATFNWKAVADSINILGGIDLEITDSEFKYINAFITETVNSTGVGSYQLEHAGMNHLDGVQAVAYARLRLMDTDFQRTERQRKVIGLALEKAKNADYATLLNIVTTVMPQISTSVTPDDLIPFMKGVSKYYISETAGFPFDKATQDVGKLDCVVPVTLESNAIKLHEFLYPGTPYIPSSGLKNISDHIIDVTGLSG